jgi:hypothetical protein
MTGIAAESISSLRSPSASSALKIMGIDPTVRHAPKLLGPVAWLAASSRFPSSQGN